MVSVRMVGCPQKVTKKFPISSGFRNLKTKVCFEPFWATLVLINLLIKLIRESNAARHNSVKHSCFVIFRNIIVINDATIIDPIWKWSLPCVLFIMSNEIRYFVLNVISYFLWPSCVVQSRRLTSGATYLVTLVRVCADGFLLACLWSLPVFTARVRSTREGTVFTGVCLSTFRGGYLPSGWWGGGYLLSSGRGGYLPWPGWGGTYSALARGGVPTLAGVGVPTKVDTPLG